MGLLKNLHLYLIVMFRTVSLFGEEVFSLEQKVGQLLMISFEGERGADSIANFLQKCPVGGVIYYNFLNGPLDLWSTKRLSDDIHSYPGIPRFIAVDQEGGRVQRCKRGFTPIPPACFLEKLGQDDLAALAHSIGYELNQAGISMNFAPVVDLTNSLSFVLEGRTISQDPFKVVKIAKTLIEGFKKNGVLGVIKHFPGHGASFSDSHCQIPRITKSFHSLLREDLIPFEFLAPHTEAIMMGHLLVTELDSEHIVTLSKKWHDYLRIQLKFDGLIISDSLVMQAVLEETKDIAEACLSALRAGTDILLIGGRFLSSKDQTLSLAQISDIHERLCYEARNDPNLFKRVEESFQRIIRAKKKWGIFKHSSLESEVS